MWTMYEDHSLKENLKRKTYSKEKNLKVTKLTS